MGTRSVIRDRRWAAALVAAALLLAPASATAAWKGGGTAHGGAGHAQAQGQTNWNGKGSACAGCHQGRGWGGSDGDHDRDDRGFRHEHRGGDFHAHAFVGVDPGWWGPYGWYGAPVYVAPPPVAVEPPQDYVGQVPSPGGTADGYWYYCPDSEAYYPTVTTCAEPRIKVRPQTDH